MDAKRKFEQDMFDELDYLQRRWDQQAAVTSNAATTLHRELTKSGFTSQMITELAQEDIANTNGLLRAIDNVRSRHRALPLSQ